MKLLYNTKSIKLFRKALMEYRLILLIGFLVTVSLELFYSKNPSDKGYLVIVALWLFLVIFYALKSTATLIVVLLYFFLFTILLVFASMDPVIERVATLIYIFILFAIVQQFIEIKRKL